MSSTKETGDETEAHVLSTLVSSGYSVSVPFGDNDAYDLIVDTGDSLYRIQCKTGWMDGDDLMVFNTRSNTVHNGEYVETDYLGKIDAFIVRLPETETLYWVDVKDATSTQMKLRFAAKIDHPSINWAEDYEFDGELS